MLEPLKLVSTLAFGYGKNYFWRRRVSSAQMEWTETLSRWQRVAWDNFREMRDLCYPGRISPSTITTDRVG